MSGPADHAAALDALAMLAAVGLNDGDVTAARHALADALESRAAPLRYAMSDTLAASVGTLAAALRGRPGHAVNASGHALALAAYDVAAYALAWHAPDVRAMRAALAAAVDRVRLAAYAPDRSAAMERLTAAARHADHPDALAHVYPAAVEPDAT